MEEPEINYYRSVGFFPRVTKFNLPKKKRKICNFSLFTLFRFRGLKNSYGKQKLILKNCEFDILRCESDREINDKQFGTKIT